MTKLTESLLDGLNPHGIPFKFADVRELRKPDTLPTDAKSAKFTPVEAAYLKALPAFEVDGENLLDVTFPPGVHRLLMIDFNTRLPWLVDTAGYDYPRYVMSVNGYDAAEGPTAQDDDKVACEICDAKVTSTRNGLCRSCYDFQGE